MQKITTIAFFFLLFLAVGCVNESSENIDNLVVSSIEELVDTTTYQLIFNYESDFEPADQDKLEKWMTEINRATQKTLGKYPFDIHVFFKNSNSSNSPVSFGLASRKNGINQVTLYVNPDATYDELMADWTAPHELSHLSIPFFGKDNKWFMEGYATFFSRQILMDMGQYTQAEFDELYLTKIQAAKTLYSSDTQNFIARSDELLSEHQYSAMYWGSASFFFTIDKRLRKERNMRFVEIIQAYQTCCRLKDRNLTEVINSFDELIGAPWCSELMLVYGNKSVNEALSDY